MNSKTPIFKNEVRQLILDKFFDIMHREIYYLSNIEQLDPTLTSEEVQKRTNDKIDRWLHRYPHCILSLSKTKDEDRFFKLNIILGEGYVFACQKILLDRKLKDKFYQSVKPTKMI